MLSATVANGDGLVVVVHPDRNERIEISDIAQIYLKRRRFWADGSQIVPINRDAGSASRERFSERIFGADSRSQIGFWNRQYFRGVLPPLTLASDEAVLRYVAREPRALGYVRESLVDERVRILLEIPARSDE
jgi:ABC-type phosphate transport system substrate-binding protein